MFQSPFNVSINVSVNYACRGAPGQLPNKSILIFSPRLSIAPFSSLTLAKPLKNVRSPCDTRQLFQSHNQLQTDFYFALFILPFFPRGRRRFNLIVTVLLDLIFAWLGKNKIVETNLDKKVGVKRFNNISVNDYVTSSVKKFDVLSLSRKI